MWDAFQREANRDGFTIEREEVIPLFHEISREMESGSYELYAEVLRRTAVEISKRLGLAAGAVALGLPAGLRRALAGLQGDQPAAQQVRQEVPDRPDLEHRRQAAGPDPAPHPARLRPRRDGAAGALLQARPRALQRVRPAHRHQEGLGAHRVEPVPRRRALHQAQGPRDLGQPLQGEARRGGRRSRPPRSRASSKRPSCSALEEIVSLHEDVLVATSQVWQTTCTIVRSGEECFVIDSPVYPDELEMLPAILAAGRLRVLRACWRPTPTGTTCSAASPSPTRRSAAPRPPPPA